MTKAFHDITSESYKS